MDFIFFDVEASGLGRESYPIEIAWISPNTNQRDNFLINPETAENWQYWDEYAEEIHCIDRNVLIQKGLSVTDASLRLKSQLEGGVLLSDAPEFDGFWLNRLFDAANVPINFELAGLDRVLTPDLLQRYKEESRRQYRYHRALSDVEAMITLIEDLRSPPAPVPNARRKSRS